MSNIKRLVICIIVYAILFGWSVCMLAKPAAASDYIGNFERVPAVQKRPAKVADWNLTPTVIVCEYAPVSEIQILSAVSFWKNLGYKFHRIQHKDAHLQKCNNPNPTGYIIIHLVTQGVKMEESALAQTHFYVDNSTNKIEWAIIYVRADLRPTVLEHELGHALGFLHYDQLNHLMNSKWIQGGWDKDGLENNQR